MTRERIHHGRLEPWGPKELTAHLEKIVNTITNCSPLDVALELLGGELEAFVMFARMGHLDPPQPDGKIPIARLQCKSDDPNVDNKIRETVYKWVMAS